MPEAQSQHHQDTRQTEAGPQPTSQTRTAHPKECTLRPREKLATWELVKPGIKGNSATSKGLASHPILLSRCRVTSPQPLWAPSREVWSASRKAAASLLRGLQAKSNLLARTRPLPGAQGRFPFQPTQAVCQKTHSPQTETGCSWAAAAPSSTQSRRPPLSLAHFTHDFCLFFVVCCFLLRPK